MQRAVSGVDKTERLREGEGNMGGRDGVMVRQARQDKYVLQASTTHCDCQESQISLSASSAANRMCGSDKTEPRTEWF